MSATNPLSRLPALRSVSIFQGLSKQHLFEVARMADEVGYPAGATVVQQGEPGGILCIVAEGVLDVYRDEQVVAHLKAGDYFGEMSLIDGEPRSASVVAVEDVVLLELSTSDFDSILAIPFVARVVMKNLVHLLREVEETH